MKKRICSLFLVLCMMLTALPVIAFGTAAEEPAADGYAQYYVQDGLTLLLTAWNNETSGADLENGTWKNLAGGADAAFRAGEGVSWVARPGKGVGYDLSASQVASAAGGSTRLELSASLLANLSGYTVEYAGAGLYVSDNGTAVKNTGYYTNYATEKLGAWGSWVIPGGDGSLSMRAMYHNSTGWGHGPTWAGSNDNSFVGSHVRTRSVAVVNVPTGLVDKPVADAEGDYIKNSVTYKQIGDRYTKDADGNYTVAADGAYFKLGDEYKELSAYTRYRMEEQAAGYSERTVYNNLQKGLVSSTKTAWNGNGNKLSYDATTYIAAPATFFIMQNCANTLYAVRVYNRVLTDAERAQNYFVDLAAFYGLDLSGLKGLRADCMAALGTAFAAYGYEEDAATVAEMQTKIDEVSAVFGEDEYAQYYVQEGLTLFLSAYDKNTSGLMLEGGMWFSSVGDSKAQVNGGVYNAETNANGWRWNGESGIYYRMADTKEYIDNQYKVGIRPDASVLFGADGTPRNFTVEAVFTPYGLADEAGTVFYHTGTVNGEGKYGAYNGAGSNFAIAGIQMCHFHPSTSKDGNTMNTRIFYNLGSWEGRVNEAGGMDDVRFFGTATAYAEGPMHLTVSAAYAADNVSYSIATEQASRTRNVAVAPFTLADLMGKANASSQPFQLFYGFPGVVYAVRTYNRVLSTEEKNQNRFADLAAYFRLNLTGFSSLNGGDKQALYAAFASESMAGEYTARKTALQEKFHAAAKAALLKNPEACMEIGKELAEYYKADLNMAGVDALPLSVQAQIYYAIANLCYDRNADQSSLWALQQSEIDARVTRYSGVTDEYAGYYVQDGLQLLLNGYSGKMADMTDGVWYSSVGYGKAAFVGGAYTAANYNGWRVYEDGGVGYGLLAADWQTDKVDNYLDIGADYLRSRDFTVEMVSLCTWLTNEDGTRADMSALSSYDYNNMEYSFGPWSLWLFRGGAYAVDARWSYHNTGGWSSSGQGNNWLSNDGNRMAGIYGTYSPDNTVSATTPFSRVVINRYSPKYDEGQALVGQYARLSVYDNGKNNVNLDTEKNGGVGNGGAIMSTTYYEPEVLKFFRLMKNAAGRMYGLRVYNRALSESERQINYLVDLAAYFELDLADFGKMDDTAKARVAARFAGYNFTSDKAEVGALLAELTTDLYTEYDRLYVQDGLVGLFTAFRNDPSVKLESGKWMNKQLSVGGAAQLKNGAIGWSAAEGGGLCYRATKADYDAGRINNTYIDLSSFLLSENVTVETLLISQGLVNEDGTPYDDLGATQYGVYNGSYAAFELGGWHMTFAPCISTGGNAGDFQLSGRWDYSTTRVWSHGNTWIANNTDTFRNGLLFANVNEATTIPQLHVMMQEKRTNGDGAYMAFRTYANLLSQVDVSTISGARNAPRYIAPETVPYLTVARSFPGTVYAVRVYNRVLSEAERQQNYFADLAAYFRLDLEGLDRVADKAAVYRAMSVYHFGSDAYTVQNALYEVTGAYTGMAKAAVGYEGIQARLGGATSGIRSLWSVDATRIAKLESNGYRVAYGAIMGIRDYKGGVLRSMEELTVAGNLTDGLTKANANTAVCPIYVTGGAEWATGIYSDESKAHFVYTMILDDASMETAEYYNIGLLFRAFVALEKDGKTEIFYIDGVGDTWGRSDSLYGEGASIAETADFFANRYTDNMANAAWYTALPRLRNILSVCGMERVTTPATSTFTFDEAPRQEDGGMLSDKTQAALSPETVKQYAFTVTESGEHILVIRLKEAAGKLRYNIDREADTVLDVTGTVLTVRAHLSRGRHAMVLCGVQSEAGTPVVTGVDVYHDSTYTFYDSDGSVLLRQTAQCGTVISAPAMQPSRRVGDWMYTFLGFDGYTEGMVLTGNVSFYAMYAAEDMQAAARAELIRAICPGFVAWGDSLTAGAGGGNITAATDLGVDLSALGSGPNGMGYVNVLQNLIRKNIHSSISVVNAGVGGETASTIASRASAYIQYVDANGNTVEKDYRMYLGADIVIPASATEEVEITIRYNSVAGREGILRQGAGNSINPFTIYDEDGNAIVGSLRIVVDAGQNAGTCDMEYIHYYFKRATAGTQVNAKKDARLKPYGEDAYDNYWGVIYVGQNGGYQNYDDLYHEQLAILAACNMISFHEDGTIKRGADGAPEGRYVVVGIHTGTAASQKAMEEAMAAYWGDHYINSRAYMSSMEALEKAGISYASLGAEDKQRMAEGTVPQGVLQSDGCHYNAIGYALLGNLIYDKIVSLGMFDALEEVLNRQLGTYED